MLIFRFLTVSNVKAISDRPKNAAKIAIVGNSGVAGDEVADVVGELAVGELVVDVDVGATVEEDDVSVVEGATSCVDEELLVEA